MRKARNRSKYDFATMVRAVEDHEVHGLSAGQAMFRNGVVSKSAFFRWCRRWREGGREAMVPLRHGPKYDRAKAERLRALDVERAMESLR